MQLCGNNMHICEISILDTKKIRKNANKQTPLAAQFLQAVFCFMEERNASHT